MLTRTMTWYLVVLVAADLDCMKVRLCLPVPFRIYIDNTGHACDLTTGGVPDAQGSTVDVSNDLPTHRVPHIVQLTSPLFSISPSPVLFV